MQKRIRTTLNFDPSGIDYQGTATGSKTLTVPDQAMTIPEILARYARGLSLENGKIPIYENDDIDDYSFIDLRKLDFTERQELRETIDNRVREMRQDMEKQRLDKEKKENERKLDLEIQRRLKEQKPPAVGAPSAPIS